ncbi:MAG: ABC transporter ATP-binding protein [Candidatus Bathyarchaeota archaeon]|nr:ABC transporter ATP-binding protein [Candidatus Bathyarchaeota archaeon]
MVNVRLINVTKRFGDVIAADDVTLDIKDGEFFTFLGPSGCGKTTTMRIVAGLEFPNEGKVFYDDKDVTQLPSFERNTGMVFQNYALWPHMTVKENVAYGLNVRKVPKDEVNKKVQEILELVKLGGLGDRFPNQLSGGQQQRVALARVLAINPDILLLDEPLSNLDAKLRVEMREEIKEIQHRLGITTIYVTHDQEEAMAVSDRVAIQNYGRIRQVGTPQEIYNKPTDLFIATFIGKGALMEGVVEKVGELVDVKIGDMVLQGITTNEDGVKPGDRVACVMRPECFTVDEPDEAFNIIEGTLEWSAFVGSITELKLTVGRFSLLCDAPSDRTYEAGAKLKIYIPKSRTIVLPWMDLD